jgi:hypothetical protein
MSTYTDAFDRICGDCTGININDITEDDIRSQGSIWGCTEGEINDAIEGLRELSESTDRYADED